MEAIAAHNRETCGKLVSEMGEHLHLRRFQTDDYTVSRGIGVVVDLVYRGENDEGMDEDEPVQFLVYPVRIERENLSFLNDGMLCVKVGDNAYVPVECFGDNENDWSASRFFKTNEEAAKHIKNVERALSVAGLESLAF